MPWKIKPTRNNHLESSWDIFQLQLEELGIDLDAWDIDISNYKRSQKCYHITAKRKDKEDTLLYNVSVPAGWYKNEYVILRAAAQLYEMLEPAETARILESR